MTTMNKTREYYHQTRDLSGVIIKSRQGEEYPTFVEHHIDYKNRIVLALQSTSIIRSHVSKSGVVPGYVLFREGNVSQIEVITDKKEKEELSTLLRSRLEGPISFWGNELDL